MKDGTYEWKGVVESVELAVSKIKELAATAPGDYVIFDQTTGHETPIKLQSGA